MRSNQTIIRVNTHENKSIYYLKFRTIEEVINNWKSPKSGYYTICLFMNNKNFHYTKLNEFFKKLLKDKFVYFMVHGKNCCKIDTLVDILIVDMKLENNDDELIMTTCHPNETVKDTIWFALNAAIPSENYLKRWKAIYFIEFSDMKRPTKIEKIINNLDKVKFV